jgi:hypothetical protein
MGHFASFKPFTVLQGVKKFEQGVCQLPGGVSMCRRAGGRPPRGWHWRAARITSSVLSPAWIKARMSRTHEYGGRLRHLHKRPDDRRLHAMKAAGQAFKLDFGKSHLYGTMPFAKVLSCLALLFWRDMMQGP